MHTIFRLYNINEELIKEMGKEKLHKVYLAMRV